MPAPPTAIHHPLFARFYARLVNSVQDRGQREHREELLRDLSGRVVEVGAGTGTNFPLYPAAVTEVVAVEPESYLRQRAAGEASRAACSVRVVDGVAAKLPLDNASCDAAVASLVLCSVADQGAALEEIARVLRRGGELRFYEHVVSSKRWEARVQRGFDLTLYPHMAGGCHLARDTQAAISRAGFHIESVRPLRFGGLPHILGVARLG
jgi:ubiquinone/menaquinone biosynthesis C-methylase UbiE